MTTKTTGKKELRRIDVLLARPLQRFRRTLPRLSDDELAAIETRIGVQIIRSRWARGGHGFDRHRVRNDLALLTRRLAATRGERDARRMSAAAAITPIAVLGGQLLAAADWEERAA